jgi:hypothetical protein
MMYSSSTVQMAGELYRSMVISMGDRQNVALRSQIPRADRAEIDRFHSDIICRPLYVGSNGLEGPASLARPSLWQGNAAKVVYILSCELLLIHHAHTESICRTLWMFCAYSYTATSTWHCRASSLWECGALTCQ